MRILRAMAPLLCLVLFMFSSLPTAKADAGNQLTFFTFSAPVEIPGLKGPTALPAGTYTFKLLDSFSDRNIVQIFNKDQTKLYATILAIPDYRPQPSEKSVIKFSETAAGGPPAIKEWFYPGNLYGQEFVYPKNRAVQLAKSANQAVPSMPQNLAVDIAKPAKTSNDASVVAMKTAPLKSEEPNGGEAEIATDFLTIQPAAPDAGANRVHNINTDSEQTSARALPKTASSLPALGMLGVCLVVMGALLWGISRRVA